MEGKGRQTDLPPVLITVMRTPQSVTDLSLRQWDQLIRQARRNRLLARLAHEVQQHGNWHAVPSVAAKHLAWAQRVADTHASELSWELLCIESALSSLDASLILLKGAAYHLAGLDVSRGRLFGDVDVLVDRSMLPAVESKMMLSGWVHTHQDPYDQQYYRSWMHELPPMQNLSRGTSIDIHHSILPETARLKTDPGKLIEESRPIEGWSFRVPCPEDMLLHAATHLFFSEGEMMHGLRDLVDIDRLCRIYLDETFAERLIARAEEMGLILPLMYAVRYLTATLATPLPYVLCQWAHDQRPGVFRAVCMDWSFGRVFQPATNRRERGMDGLANAFLFVRAHWQKMPLHLLVTHMTRKAWKTRQAAWHGQTGVFM